MMSKYKTYLRYLIQYKFENGAYKSDASVPMLRGLGHIRTRKCTISLCKTFYWRYLIWPKFENDAYKGDAYEQKTQFFPIFLKFGHIRTTKCMISSHRKYLRIWYDPNLRMLLINYKSDAYKAKHIFPIFLEVRTKSMMSWYKNYLRYVIRQN